MFERMGFFLQTDGFFVTNGWGYFYNRMGFFSRGSLVVAVVEEVVVVVVVVAVILI